MRMSLIILALCVVLTIQVLGEANIKDVKEEKEWLNYVLPLPHEFSIKQTRTLLPKDVGLTVAGKIGTIEENAIAELKQFYKKNTGMEPVGKKFEIVIGIVDSDGKVSGNTLINAERLKGLPNSDQAYLIEPVGNSILVLAALKPKGLYYAVQTLKQLLSKEIGKDSLSIPLVTIVDWPDYDQRGVWNAACMTPDFIRWMSSLKLNFTHVSARIVLTKGEKAKCSKLPMKEINEARDCAFTLMPHCPHYDYWWRYGRDKIYPELVGKGKGARNPCFNWGGAFKKSKCPCMATSLQKRLLTEWIESAAKQGVREVSLWQSEHTCQCECTTCLKDGRKQMQKEVQASVDAILEARKTYPDLQGRVFLCLTKGKGSTDEDLYECLKIIPPEIKVERVYGRDKAFDKFAVDGNWLTTYSGPRIGSGYYVIRYAVDMLKTKIKEYYDGKYSGFYSLTRSYPLSKAYGDWTRRFANYQYSALAEWTWNVRGRNPVQFAEAWATINGFSSPDQFAEWAQIIEPVETFARNRALPRIYLWLNAATSIDKKATPNWFRVMPKTNVLRKLLAACDKALPIAEKISESSVALETRYLRTLVQAMVQFDDLRQACVNNPVRKGVVETSVKAFVASISELETLCGMLMDTPKLGKEVGQGMCRKNHDSWTQSLKANVESSIEQKLK